MVGQSVLDRLVLPCRIRYTGLKYCWIQLCSWMYSWQLWVNAYVYLALADVLSVSISVLDRRDYSKLCQA